MDDDIEHSDGGGPGGLAPGLMALSDDELTVGYDEVMSASRRAEWDRLAVEAEIERRRMFRTDGTASLREWIALRSAEGDRAAYHRARMAQTLPAFPGLSAALAAGDLSFDHVRLLLTLAHLTGADDEELVDVGVSHTVPQLETACRAARRRSRRDDDDGHRRRFLRWRRDDEGTFHLYGRLYGLDGITVTTLLTAMAETAATDPAATEPDPFDVRCADALVEICTGPPDARPAGEGVIHIPIDTLRPDPDGDSGVGEPVEDLVDDADLLGATDDLGDADGLGATDGRSGRDGRGGRDGRVGRDGVGGDDAGGLDGFDLRGPDPYGVERDHLDRRHLDRRHSDGCRGGTAMTWDGTVLSAAAVRRLLCDASVRVTVDDADGRAVGIGRKSRTIPGWLHHQLRWRDQGCRFPGCERTRWLHGHHLRHWADGGPTDLSNLLQLCSRHHRAVHEGGWRIHGHPDSTLTFTGPTGNTHTSRPALHPTRLHRRPQHRPRPTPAGPPPTPTSPDPSNRGP
jgi:hypothetical protein